MTEPMTARQFARELIYCYGDETHPKVRSVQGLMDQEFNAGVEATVKSLALHYSPHVTEDAMMSLVEDLKRPEPE
ncbi:hypothetical protein LCGC14_1584050 [marine sediment metagenome]|uniref:Uncharacterized protein n=1 Tax=marine sediment metagenome TaxID=412755 RepID=A0A0F9IG42_9ZZZZ